MPRFFLLSTESAESSLLIATRTFFIFFFYSTRLVSFPNNESEVINSNFVKFSVGPHLRFLLNEGFVLDTASGGGFWGRRGPGETAADVGEVPFCRISDLQWSIYLFVTPEFKGHSNMLHDLTC